MFSHWIATRLKTNLFFSREITGRSADTVTGLVVNVVTSTLQLVLLLEEWRPVTLRHVTMVSRVARLMCVFLTGEWRHMAEDCVCVCSCDRISDLVDLWVIKIKKPMILCAHSTSRSREQNTKRRSSSENTWKVCLFYSQNNKIVWLSNMANILVWEIQEVRKGLWSFYSKRPSQLDFLALSRFTVRDPVSWVSWL